MTAAAPTPPNVALELASRAEDVTLVREVLAGLADAVDFGDALDDIKAAVSEAANNVVVHAYGGAEGPLEVELRVRPFELEALVRDRGVGGAAPMPAPIDDETFTGGGIGLKVIEALSTRSELRAHDDGTEVAMWFAIPDPADSLEIHDRDQVRIDGDVRIAIAPARLSAGILGRLVGALGARAGFSIDRLSDAQLVTDALAARLGPALDGTYLSVALALLEGRTLALRVGELATGAAAGVLAASAVGDIGPLIERLSDEVDVSAGERGEVMCLLLRDAAGS